MGRSGTAGSRRSRAAGGSIGRTCSAAAPPMFPPKAIASRRRRSKPKGSRCSTHWRFHESIASLVLCNTPTRISDEIRGIYALDQENTAAAIRAHGTGAWCRQTLGYRLDLDHSSAALQEWVIAEVDKTRRDIAAALHDCFESVDLRPLLPGIKPPVLLLSGDKSRIASEQQKILADTLPRGRLDLFAGYGHGVNLLQPERCARAALDFWRAVEAEDK